MRSIVRAGLPYVFESAAVPDDDCDASKKR